MSIQRSSIRAWSLQAYGMGRARVMWDKSASSELEEDLGESVRHADGSTRE